MQACHVQLKKDHIVDSHLFDKVEKAVAKSDKDQLKTWQEDQWFCQKMVGLTIAIHNGRLHVPVYITENMVGYKLGEFAATRTFRGHSSDKKAKGAAINHLSRGLENGSCSKIKICKIITAEMQVGM